MRLDSDIKTASAWLVPIENAKKIDEVAGAPIVNLDSDFLIPASEQGMDFSFARLTQVMKIVKEQEARGSQKTVPMEQMLQRRQSRPHRPPDYAKEWKVLKRAWTLHRNQKEALSKKKIEEGSDEFYGKDPLDHLPDWLWRISMFMSQPAYEPKFQALIMATDVLNGTSRFDNFLKAYSKQVAPYRGKKYLDIIKDYFANYSEFSQVFFLITQGIQAGPDYQVTSSGFKQTKMFYGDAFERFATLAELLAFLNNMIAGREWDQFEHLTLAEYRKLDRASVFNAFSANVAYSDICNEADNQVRNASHHGSMRYDPTDGIIRYKTGKGSQGAELTLSYTMYLERCVRLFLQTLTLLRFEVMLCRRTNLSYPL